MYIPQKLKTLLLLAALAAAAFLAYRHPYIRTLVNREAAKQGIAIDPNSPEAQILRAKGSYDDRPDEEIRKEEIKQKVEQFRSIGLPPCKKTNGSPDAPCIRESGGTQKSPHKQH